MNDIVKRIDERLAAVNLSRQAASLKAGLSKDYIRDLARSKNVSPSIAAIEKLAPVLGTTIEWLRGKDTVATESTFRPPAPVITEEIDLPVFRSAEGGPGYIVVNGNPIGFTSRPAKLKNNVEAFAVVVAGESMSPEYEAGDMIFVDPYKPLVRDRNFIFIDDSHGEWKACVKRLISWDSENFNVLQHNPPSGQQKNFTLKRSEWQKAFRVLGKYDRD